MTEKGKESNQIAELPLEKQKGRERMLEEKNIDCSNI